ncbi:Mdm33 family-domain-containing protein [Crucibulum laeve]|uniref:Sensitive to high expression protein 9, mitochondrial n=1 Tax=Crucibulum laeve TaxID=68775 RepID=A0A5C3M7P7_9AGAR|nr:Mdm33 family-domain-containing protein [Crucibulum laeve]
MLRTPLSRSLLLRQFSVSARASNTTRPTQPNDPLKVLDGVRKPEQSLPPPAESIGLPPPPPPPPPPSPIASASASSTTPSSSLSSYSSSIPKKDAEETRSSLPAYDLELVKQRIRDWTAQASHTFRNRADDFTASTKTTFSQLGSQLNEVTGYKEIEALKREERIQAARQAARDAKTAYEQAVIQRSNSQREVNDLLQRKSLWTDSDVGRFTSLVRQDHLYEQEETRAKAAVDETEDAVEREFSKLMRVILARYHEEQVWSDKIRSASTYGSLAALGLNLLVFVMAIIVVEPWKRRRLAQTFEKKIEELSKENAMRVDANMEDIGKQLAIQKALMARFVEDVTQKVERIPDHRQDEGKIPPVEVIPESIPVNVGWTQRRDVELAVVGASAFITGIIGCFFLGR